MSATTKGNYVMRERETVTDPTNIHAISLVLFPQVKVQILEKVPEFLH
jgi:hypothetical protein